MDRSLHLFIIWDNARFMEKNILNDIKKNFNIFQVYEITWTRASFAHNLTRFYGKKLPKGCKKEKEIGKGPFLSILAYDNHPRFSENKNSNIVSAKHKYRHLLGKNLVHASDNMTETDENILFLLGKNIKEIEKEQAFLSPVSINNDIRGETPWNSIDEALSLTKKIPFTKVVAYKESFLIHSRNADIVRRLLNASPCRFKIPGRHKYYVKVGKSKQPVYIRKVH